LRIEPQLDPQFQPAWQGRPRMTDNSFGRVACHANFATPWRGAK
jgi:hypothetical protein